MFECKISFVKMHFYTDWPLQSFTLLQVAEFPNSFHFQDLSFFLDFRKVQQNFEKLLILKILSYQMLTQREYVCKNKLEYEPEKKFL